MALRGILLSLLAFAVFATHDVFIKYLGAHYSAFQLIFFSSLLSFPLATLMLMRDSTAGTLRPVNPGWIALRTLSSSMGAICAFYAFSVLPLAQVYALIFAMPLLITVLSIPILKEKVSVHRWSAVLIGLAGVLVVLRPGSSEFTLGHAAALAAACFAALGSVILRRVGRQERSVVIMLYPLLTNFVVSGIALSWVYKPMPIEHLGMVGFIALFAFVAGLLLIAAYNAAEAAIVAPMQYSQIIWATLFGYFLFSETIDTPTLIGSSIIIASGLYIVFRESSGKSANTPVLRTRQRSHSPGAMRVSFFLRRKKKP
ncbi:MAG: DMT family transporter [Amylibacter sp.]|jgi:drug/metabolite transporter (DMT)-like permease|nr:DMT family transporter [Amylibacter sp.]